MADKKTKDNKIIKRLKSALSLPVMATSLIGSVIVLFVITAITSTIKVWQTARANPVKLLRTE